MRTVRLLEPYSGKKKGDTISVDNNDAHALIDMGVAELIQFSKASKPNKMMGPKKNKQIKLK